MSIKKMRNIMEQLASVNVTDTPKFKVLVALRDALVLEGFDNDYAEKLVARMEISIYQFDEYNEDWIATIKAYAKLISNVHTAYKMCFDNYEYMLLNSAEPFTFKAEF